MTKQEAFEAIKDVILDMDDEQLVNIHNQYVCGIRDDAHIYPHRELDEVLEGLKPLQIINRIVYGSYNHCCAWFMFDGYGNIKSIWGEDLNDEINIDDIADYCVEQEDSLMVSEIQDILDQIEYEDEGE